MDIVYQKSGVVKVQDVNLEDPKGKPINIEIDFVMETVTLGVEAWDDLNTIGRVYELDMDDQFKADISQFFLVNIARLMRENYTEFTGLSLVD